MNWKTRLIVIGVILLLGAFVEFVFGGAVEALLDCQLDLDCYFLDELVSLEISIVLLVLGVLSILASITIGRSPGD